MCLVIAVLLGALSVNFLLNGFWLQALIMALMTFAAAFFMIRNIRCTITACGFRKHTHKSDRNIGECSPSIKSTKQTDF